MLLHAQRLPVAIVALELAANKPLAPQSHWPMPVAHLGQIVPAEGHCWPPTLAPLTQKSRLLLHKREQGGELRAERVV